MRLAVLTLDVDKANQQVNVYLKTENEGIEGKLPSFSNLESCYKDWQKGINQSSSNSNLEVDTQSLAEVLNNKINRWLKSEGLQGVRDKLIDFLAASQNYPNRIVIKTDDAFLQRIPWYCWKELDNYSNTEITISFKTGKTKPDGFIPPQRSQLRLLAVLGDSENISLERDIDILKSLSRITQIKIDSFHPSNLTADKLARYLWNSLCDRNYDILFFAGHGVGDSDKQTDINRLVISNTTYLDISLSDLESVLESALENAIEKGLRLAIFNSCCGMKLGQTLAKNYGLTTIVMREKIRDDVAVEFLDNFVKAFYSGKPVCLAVKEARKKLLSSHDISQSWLPVIFQNESADSLMLKDWVLPNILEFLCSIGLTGFNAGLIAIFLGTFLGILVNPTFWVLIVLGVGLLSVWLFAVFPKLSKKNYLLTISGVTLVSSITFIVIHGFWFLLFPLLLALASVFGVSSFCFLYYLRYPVLKLIQFSLRFISNVKQAIEQE
jgi:hypothetical protein